MTTNLELTGRRALVTGGTKGIGQAVAAKLREAGATVLITAQHDENPGVAGVDCATFRREVPEVRSAGRALASARD